MRFKHGWFHMKLYSVFRDLSRRSIRTMGFQRKNTKIFVHISQTFPRNFDYFCENYFVKNAKTRSVVAITIKNSELFSRNFR